MNSRQQMPCQMERQQIIGVVCGMFGAQGGSRVAWLFVVLFVLTMGLMPAAAWQIWLDWWRDGWSGIYWENAWGLLPFPLLLAWTLWKIRQKRGKLRSRVRTQKISSRCGVILTLSNLRENVQKETEGALKQGESMKVLFEKTKPYHPWQQTCRMLEPHAKDLRWIGIVHSRESLNQQELFLAVVKSMLSLRNDVQFSHSQQTDLAKAELVMDEIQDLMKQAMEEHRIPADQLVIDVTGGPKAASVAGIMAALSHQPEEVTLQYVDTSPPHEALSMAYRAFQEE